MSDQEFLEQYLATPEERQEDVKNTFFDKPIAAPEASPVKVELPAKTEEEIKKGKKSPKSFLKSAGTAKKNTEKVLGAAVPSIDDVPLPPAGGIGLLLFIALLIVFAIMPAGTGGESRLSLLWGAVLGNYTMKKGGSTTQSSGNARNPSGQVKKNPLPPDPLDPWGIQGGMT